MKNCEWEGCGKEIPDDYGNLLCDEHYRELEAQNEAKAKEVVAEAVPAPEPPPSPVSSPSDPSKFGITDPNYQENPEKEDKEQWEANLSMFQRNGVLLWKPTRLIYTYIKDWCMGHIQEHPQFPKFLWRPRIVDVGCGIGVGSNVLSQEADFVWGIDKNLKSIQFAKEAFERNKNGIYYSSQVSFEHLDFMTDTRETMKFDCVVAVEVIEHIYDTHKFLKTMIEKFDKRKEGYEATTYFFSTPNRNNDSIRKDRPFNLYHVREYTSGEGFNYLSNYFGKVELFSAAGVVIPENEYQTTTHTPLLYKCSLPKL